MLTRDGTPTSTGIIETMSFVPNRERSHFHTYVFHAYHGFNSTLPPLRAMSYSIRFAGHHDTCMRGCVPPASLANMDNHGSACPTKSAVSVPAARLGELFIKLPRLHAG